MTSWMARAKEKIAQSANSGTGPTDDRGVSSVLAVRGNGDSGNLRGVSSVLSVRWDRIPEKHTLAADLVDAAMKVCDRHGDGESAREEMRRQCLDLPMHLQADLLEHFRGKRSA